MSPGRAQLFVWVFPPALLGGCPPTATPRPKEFRADHPFRYLLWDRENGRIVFMGRVVVPRGNRTYYY